MARYAIVVLIILLSCYCPGTPVSFSLLTPGSVLAAKTQAINVGGDPKSVPEAPSLEESVWRSPWFIFVVVVLLGTTGLQAGMLIWRGRRLREANLAISSVNQELSSVNEKLGTRTVELERVNSALLVEGAVERIRGEVQAMEQAADFERVLSPLSDSLREVGLEFESCGIDVLEEPIDEPSIEYFVEQGFHYTTYSIDHGGSVSAEVYDVAAPFPVVIQETIERFIAGEPWQGRSGNTSIVEVPASNFGRLRIAAQDRPEFSVEEIRLLRDFAVAIALGYARHLDFKQLEEKNESLERANLLIQEQTERKSQFLASMSHELRTPMNAIIGFTRIVLRRAADVLPERQVENLDKVKASADHLLGLINSILDLSKIEAGRMDVEVKKFDVSRLIVTSCATVAPLVKAGVELLHEVDDGVAEVETDEGRLRQIVINLLSNALKFTDQGKVVVRVLKETGDLVISVSDTGTGIPEHALESIFEEFKQVEGTDLEHKGTGLGLSITKSFTELLGGGVSVESIEGKGSTFEVRIPVIYEVS